MEFSYLQLFFLKICLPFKKIEKTKEKDRIFWALSVLWYHVRIGSLVEGILLVLEASTSVWACNGFLRMAHFFNIHDSPLFADLCPVFLISKGKFHNHETSTMKWTILKKRSIERASKSTMTLCVAACLNLTYPSSLTDINKVKITGKKALTRCHL